MPPKGNGKKRQTQYEVARQAVKDALKKTLEVKKFSFAWALGIGNTPLAWNPIAINLFDYIEQGNNDEDRDGNRINCLSTELRCNLESADSPYNQLRIMLVETRKPLPLDVAGTYYSASSVFRSLAALGLNSFVDRDIVKHIYMDKLVTLNQQVVGQNIIKFKNRFVKFGKYGKRVYYDGNITATLGEATQTYLYFVAMSDSTLVPHPRINMVWENSFVDP